MESICRACRNSLEAGSIELIARSERFGCTVWKMMYDCTQIEVNTDVRLPSSLCFNCVNQLEMAYTFLVMCRESMEFFSASLSANDHDHALVPQETIAVDVKTEVDTEAVFIKYEPPATLQDSYTDDHSSEGQFNSAEDEALLKSLASNDEKSGISEAERKARKRELNRRRAERWRLRRTPEQIIADREKGRIRKAEARRNNAQRSERERLENRLRAAMWRAKRTPEQAQAARDKERERKALLRKATRDTGGVDGCEEVSTDEFSCGTTSAY